MGMSWNVSVEIFTLSKFGSFFMIMHLAPNFPIAKMLKVIVNVT